MTETRIDRYILEEPLGSGGFSTVYRARHSLIGNQVAFKLLKPEHARRGVTAERFIREARTAASIGNPHIVKVHDCGESAQGDLFLVMELLEGRVLSEVIDGEAPLELRRAVDIACQSLDGLAAAHEAGIVHRDIKPENIFLTPPHREGEPEFVKLLDFGISKLLDRQTGALTTAGEVLGTPMYMSPEQIVGSDQVDHHVDLYGMAAVLYHMLSGRPPHDARSLPELAHKILTETPPALAQLGQGHSEALSAVVARGLAREPADRWPTARAFAEALASFGAVAIEPGASTPTQPNAPPQAPLAVGQPPSAVGQDAFVTDQTMRPSGATATPPQQTWPGASGPSGFPAVGQPPSQLLTAQGFQTGSSSPSEGSLGGLRKLPLWLIFILVGVVATVLGGTVVAVVALAASLLGDDGGSSQVTAQRGQTTTGQTTTGQTTTGQTTTGQVTTGQTTTGQTTTGQVTTGQTTTGGVGQPGYSTTGAPLNTTAPPSTALRQGVPINGVLPYGQTLNYPLQVDRRGLITIALQSSAFDTFLYLLQNNLEVGRDDDGGGGYNSQLSMWLEPGQYTVRVGSYGDTGGGQFTLSVFQSL